MRPPEDLRKQWPASLSKLSRWDRHACVCTAQFSRVPFLWKIKSNVLAVISFSSYHAHTKAEVPFLKKKRKKKGPRPLPTTSWSHCVWRRDTQRTPQPQNQITSVCQLSSEEVRRHRLEWERVGQVIIEGDKIHSFRPCDYWCFCFILFYFTVKGITEQAHQAEDGARTSVWEARGIS